MSRVINPETAGKERKQLSRAVVLAIRELMSQTETNANTRDLAAFIALALIAIHETIDGSVGAWEKRGYWIKADRFRMEWMWSESLGKKMEQAVLAEDWATVAATVVQIGEKLNSVKLPQRHRLGKPWIGAYKKLKESQDIKS